MLRRVITSHRADTGTIISKIFKYEFYEYVEGFYEW